MLRVSRGMTPGALYGRRSGTARREHRADWVFARSLIPTSQVVVVRVNLSLQAACSTSRLDKIDSRFKRVATAILRD